MVLVPSVLKIRRTEKNHHYISFTKKNPFFFWLRLKLFEVLNVLQKLYYIALPKIVKYKIQAIFHTGHKNQKTSIVFLELFEKYILSLIFNACYSYNFDIVNIYIL